MYEALPSSENGSGANLPRAGSAGSEPIDVEETIMITTEHPQCSGIFRIGQPMGGMTLSPTNRDVALADKTGLFIIDLENPYAIPRFLAHRTTWDVADIQWNPHTARSEWVASTVRVR